MNVMLLHHQMSFYGGAEKLITKLSTYLTQHDIDNTIFTLSKPPDIPECRGLNVITPKEEFSYKNWSLSLSDGLTLIKKISSLNKLYHDNIKNFDIVNIHNFPAILSAFPKQKPTVWMCNEPPDLWYDSDDNHNVFEKTLRNLFLSINKSMINKTMDSIVVSDRFNYDRIVARYNKPTTIVPYGIEHEIFSNGNPESAIQKYELDNNFIVLQTGVIARPKNQMESVITIEKLKSTIPNIKLILAGLDNGSYAEGIKKYIKQHNLSDHIIMTGHLSASELSDLYQSCNVAVYPIHSQGGWLSPFEAMCAEKPVIVSEEMTASDIISKEKIGTVINNLQNSILEVYKNPDLFVEMAKKGKKYVVENLSWDKFCGEILNVFETTR